MYRFTIDVETGNRPLNRNQRREEIHSSNCTYVYCRSDWSKHKSICSTIRKIARILLPIKIDWSKSYSKVRDGCHWVYVVSSLQPALTFLLACSLAESKDRLISYYRQGLGAVMNSGTQWAPLITQMFLNQLGCDR